MCVCNGPDESVRAQGRGWCDCWQAPSRHAEIPNSLRALPSPPHHPYPLLLSQSSAPHICCVLATDSKLKHPGPLSDSTPFSSHVPLLPPAAPLSTSPYPRLSISLLFLSFWSVFLLLSVIYLLALQLPQPCQISLPFLSFSHFCYTSHPPFFYCVTLHSAPSRTLPFRSPFTFSKAGPCCLSFTGFSASLSLPLSHPPPPPSLSGNRCCLSDLIITG